MGNRAIRGDAGLTLLEISIATMVLAIAIVGSFGLIVRVQSHNQSYNDARLATKAAQEVMEMVLAAATATPNPDAWSNTWNGIGVNHTGGFIVPQLHPGDSTGNYELGDVTITDISTSVALPFKSLYEIVVTVNGKGHGPNGKQVTVKPLNVTLVTRRSYK